MFVCSCMVVHFKIYITVICDRSFRRFLLYSWIRMSLIICQSHVYSAEAHAKRMQEAEAKRKQAAEAKRKQAEDIKRKQEEELNRKSQQLDKINALAPYVIDRLQRALSSSSFPLLIEALSFTDASVAAHPTLCDVHPQIGALRSEARARVDANEFRTMLSGMLPLIRMCPSQRCARNSSIYR
jgi:hypothetical protein